MGSISRMAKKCQKCPDRDKCDKKRMESLAYIDTPASQIQEPAISFTPNISVNIAGEMRLEDIAKEISRKMSCAIGRW